MEATTQVGELDVEIRTGQGKSEVRKLRQSGRIPGICYGKGADPVALSLDPTALLRALDPDKRTNTLIKMRVAGAGGAAPEELTVMLRDWQRDAIRGNVTHADFVRVRLDQEVHAVVPIHLTGKAEGVKLGGTLHQVYRSLEVACTPDKIPTHIDVKVDALGMGDALHVRDLALPAGVRALLDAAQTICTVTVPKAEKAAEATVEAAAEGAAAAPAEGAKAAAPADEKKAGGEKKGKKE